MLSIEQIRENPDEVRRALETRGEGDSITAVLELDIQVRRVITQRDDLNAERNRVSKEIGQARSRGQEASEDVRSQMRKIGNQADALNQQTKDLSDKINTLLLELPNLPQSDVPVGEDESGNIIVRQNGEPPVMGFTPQPHWDLGEQLGIIDFERGTKLAGSRFYNMLGAGPKLERSLIAWMLDLHSLEHGYTEVSLPAVVKREIMEGSGNLPKFADNLYHDEEDDLWLIPTAEVPITNLYRDEIIPANTLPLKYVAQTPCFRRERASAGRDTRGIKRVHQFNKVEMYKFVEPETSNQELEQLVDDAEDVCRKLGIQLPGVTTLHRRHGLRFVQDLRHRGLGSRLPGVAGGQLLLQLYRFPGPALQHPLPDRRGWPSPISSHAERIRLGPAPCHYRHHGELPTGRRLDRNPRGPAPVHRIRRNPRQGGGIAFSGQQS